jgi:nucleoid-associated protein YgaU
MLRGPDAPKMVGGGGGWTVEPRPRRIGLTIWGGRDPYMMDVPIMFDGWAKTDSQETKISTLNQMQMGGDLEEPPYVEIDGAVPVKGIRWVITSIDWGETVIWASLGLGKDYRMRQDAIVHLTQYNPEDRLVVQGGGNLQTPKMYRVKKNDSFKSISQKMYGTPDKWRNIMAANKIRDSKTITSLIGKEIRIP